MSDFHIMQSRTTSEPYLTDRGARGMAVSIVFTILAMLFVIARLYTRIWLMKRVEANDWLILVALSFSFAFMGCYIAEAVNGMGMHGNVIPPSVLKAQMKAFWVTIPLYNTAVLLSKATILMQYLRVFPARHMRIISWTMIAVLGTYGTWCVLSAFLNCIPVARFWDPSIPGHCLSQKHLWYSNAGMHIATDLAILAIPIPALWKLNLPRRQKIVLMGIFALGGFVCITSICRLVSLKKIANSSDPTCGFFFLPSPYPPITKIRQTANWCPDDNVGAASWSAVECNVGIICACLPTLRPLVSTIIPHLLSSIGGSGHTRSDNESLFHAPAPLPTAGPNRTAYQHDEEYGYPTQEAERVLAMLRGHGIDGEKFKETVVNMEAIADPSVTSYPRK